MQTTVRLTRMRFPLHHCSILGLAAALFVSSCAPYTNTAADLYKRAQDAERLNDRKDAEKHYLDCVSAAEDCESEYYQLAAINRLSDLEKALHSHSKAKTYMIKAATLAENIKDPDADKSDTESLQLAKEKHTALMRLADWELEDGNYVSARKLYAKAAGLEPQMKIDPEDATSATARITKLDKRASIEHEQISIGISKKPVTKRLRGPEFGKRSDERRNQFDRLHSAANEFSKNGGKELGRKVLERLAELRTEYGVREGEYRNNLRYVSNLFIVKNEPDLIAPVIEEDLQQFSNFSMKELDAAIPVAVDNATNFARDHIFLGLVRQYQGRWKDMLESCRKAEQIAPKVIAKNSADDYSLTLETAVALEQNNRQAEAVPYRKRALDMFKLHDSALTSYSEYLSSYANDLAAARRFSEAEATYKEVCALKRKLKQTKNFSYALNAYASMLIDQSRYAEARKLLLESEPYSEKDMPRFQLINCYMLLYKACKNIDPKEAIKYAKRAQDTVRKYGTFGRDFYMEQCVLDQASLEMQLDKYKDALKTLERGVQWQDSHGRKSSSYTAAMLNLKATALGVLGDADASEKCRLEAIDICRHLNPPQPGPLASTLFQTAPHLTLRQKFTQAEKLYREAIDIVARMHEKEYDHLGLMCKAALGTTLVVSGKNRAEAERLKAELLSSYKSYFRHVTQADISLCLTISELCFVLKDKKNCQLLLNEAQSIYDRDKLHGREMLSQIEGDRKKFHSLLH